MPITSATDVLLSTAKDTTVSLRQSQWNILLPPPYTQSRHVLVRFNEIYSNVTKPAESTHNNLPRVPMITVKNPADFPRVPTITNAEFIDITATNRRLLWQKNKATKTSNTSKIPNIPNPVPPLLPRPMPLPSPQPHISPSNHQRSQLTPRPTVKLRKNLKFNNFVSTHVQLPPQLQHLVNN